MSETDRKTALVLSKVARLSEAIPYRWLDGLKYDHRDLALKVIQAGTDPEIRRGVLRAELLARSEADLWKQVEVADPDTDPDQLESPGYAFKTLGETYVQLPPLRWAIQKLFARPSVSIIFGAPKGLKTMLVLEAAICVAGAKKWLTNEQGLGGFEVQTCPVGWIDLENGPRRMTERISAFGRGRVLPESVPFFGLRCLLRGWTRAILSALENSWLLCRTRGWACW